MGAVQEAIERLVAATVDEAIGDPQDPAQATKAPRLSKEDGSVDWTRTAQQIKNQVRAFQPWPGTYSNLVRAESDPVRLIFEQVSVVAEGKENAAQPGQVACVDKDRLLIATGDGLLSLDRVQPAGKRAMAIGDWLRGHPLTVEDRFDSQ